MGGGGRDAPRHVALGTGQGRMWDPANRRMAIQPSAAAAIVGAPDNPAN